jgi:competence protein ComEA
VRAAVESTSPLPVISGSSSWPARLLERFVSRWVPQSWRGSRLDPGRSGALVLVCVASVAAMIAAIGVWRDRPVPEPPPALAVVGPAGQTTPSMPHPPKPTGGQLVVSVVGKVRKPGLVRLPDGARVADAIAHAGGPLPGADLTTVNLARRVADGEQIPVGLPQPPVPDVLPGEPAPSASGPLGATAAGASRGKVALNQATAEQLDALPGVGPVTAQRILDWRTRHGRFTSVDQLREVDGIGERRFGQLKDLVTP